MLFFEKPVYKYQEMNFILDEFSDYEPDDEKCLIDIEAYGNIDGEMKYCYSSFSLKKQEMYENGDFESMLNLLRSSENKTVLVELKYKKGIVKDFRLMLDSLVKAYNDERFLQLELTGWGLNDKSCRKI
ncbi:MAG: hypothetical protein PUG48_08145 [Clostridia bacterium]|nr:hypothetical protein [Clostridia bacterium]